jgi:hypothetical protein
MPAGACAHPRVATSTPGARASEETAQGVNSPTLSLSSATLGYPVGSFAAGASGGEHATSATGSKNSNESSEHSENFDAAPSPSPPGVRTQL